MATSIPAICARGANRNRNRKSSPNSIPRMSGRTIRPTFGNRTGSRGTPTSAYTAPILSSSATASFTRTAASRAQSKKGLKHLDRGSVIAFGSGKEIGGQRKWVLDTVLVVKDSFPYDPLDPLKALDDKVPDEFLEVTGGPLVAWAEELRKGSVSAACAPTSERLRLYRGASPQHRVDGMFSFLPAIPADGGSCFPRPVVSLDDKYFSSSNWQAPKGSGRNLCSDTIRDLWGSLVTQVRKDGLVLGTRAEMPERRAG